MNKEDKLKIILKSMKSAVLALSGGLDSSYLALITYRALGNNCLAITALSPSTSKQEREDAKLIVQWIGIPHRFISSHEMNQEEYRNNNGFRCYYCKKEILSILKNIAKIEDYHFIIDGSNCDDLKDVRPGRKAAEELGIRSPLLEAGFYKKDIRSYAKKNKLPLWNKPPSPCLASRIPQFSEITPEKLQQIEAGESFIRSLGFTIFRLRHHGTIARLEFSLIELNLLLDNSIRKKIITTLKTLGFRYITIDLEGYRLSGLS